MNGKVVKSIQYLDIPEGDVILSITASSLFYKFTCRTNEDQVFSIGNALTKDLSSENIGGFTGVYIGMYATGNGRKCSNPADFDYFDYIPLKK